MMNASPNAATGRCDSTATLSSKYPIPTDTTSTPTPPSRTRPVSPERIPVAATPRRAAIPASSAVRKNTSNATNVSGLRVGASNPQARASAVASTNPPKMATRRAYFPSIVPHSVGRRPADRSRKGLPWTERAAVGVPSAPIAARASQSPAAVPWIISLNSAGSTSEGTVRASPRTTNSQIATSPPARSASVRGLAIARRQPRSRYRRATRRLSRSVLRFIRRSTRSPRFPGLPCSRPHRPGRRARPPRRAGRRRLSPPGHRSPRPLRGRVTRREPPFHRH